jgi:cyclopropane fatty-acyl-phospholipid synthase-like methyltransferase
MVKSNIDELITRNNDIYFESANRYPHDHRGVHWSSEQVQFIRFKILCEIDPMIWHSSILDVGCGLGHLVDYLLSKHFTGTYKGIDLVNAMVLAAKKRHSNFDFENNDIGSVAPASYDYLLASGIFPFVDQAAMQHTIKNLFKCAKKGIAFNCLSILSNPVNPALTYYDPKTVYEFCRGISDKVVLINSYLPNDFTLYLYK